MVLPTDNLLYGDARVKPATVTRAGRGAPAIWRYHYPRDSPYVQDGISNRSSMETISLEIGYCRKIRLDLPKVVQASRLLVGKTG